MLSIFSKSVNMPPRVHTYTHTTDILISKIFFVYYECPHLVESCFCFVSTGNARIFSRTLICIYMCVCVCSLNFLFLQDHILFLEFEPLFFISLAFLKCLMTLIQQFIFMNRVLKLQVEFIDYSFVLGWMDNEVLSVA